MRYKIVGGQAIAGIEPGGTVEMSPEEAAWLIEAGHLEPVSQPKEPGTTKRKEGE